MTRLNRPIMPPAATSQTRRRSGFPSRLPGFLQAQPRSGDDPRPMRTNERTSAELRDAALVRLRRLTVGVAGLATGALAVFGVTAAATIPGTSTPATASAPTSTSTPADSTTTTTSSTTTQPSTTQPSTAAPQASSSGSASSVAVSGGSR